MPEPIVCPSCQKPLRVPADFHLAWLTCPRCLAVVPNPAAQAITPSPAPPVLETYPMQPAVETPDATRRLDQCPSCGKPADPNWVFCPYCEEPMRAPRGMALERDVRRDTRRTGTGMIVLATLGGLAILWALVGTGAEAFGDRDPGPFVGVLVGLAVLFGISTLIVMIRSKGNLQSRGIGRLVVSTLALTGGLVAAGFLLSLAVVVFLLAVCLVGAGKRC